MANKVEDVTIEKEEVVAKADLTKLRYLPVDVIEKLAEQVYNENKDAIDLYFSLKNAIANNKLVSETVE